MRARAKEIVRMRVFLGQQLSIVMGQVVYATRMLIDAITDLTFNYLYSRRYRRSLPAVNNKILLESALTLAKMIREKEMTSEQLVTLCIERIKEVNPILNAVVDDRFQEALEDARIADRIVACLCDQALEALAVDAPFLGVPFSTKEGIRVKGLHHSYGCSLRSEHRASSDADAVALLRKAGAIPLCVTNVSELGTWWESANAVYGQTNNPYDNRRTPGGSSGGEAALQAAAAVPLSLGSDTGGSIRTPAAFCGLFGHKPTPGLVSVRGSSIVDPPKGHVSLMTCLGPISRNAGDLIPALKSVLEAPARDDLLQLDKDVTMSKLRYFYLDGGIGGPGVSRVSPEIRQGLMRVVYYLEDVYGIVAKPVKLNGMEQAFNMYMETLEIDSYEPKLNHVMCSSLGVEWVQWMMGKGEHNFPFLVNATMESLDGALERLKGSRSAAAKAIADKTGDAIDDDEEDDDVKKEMKMMTTSITVQVETLKNELKELLGEDGVLLCPTHPTIAPFHLQSYLKPINVMYAAIWNVLGMPATTIPVGLSNEEAMPLSIQAVASPMCDRLTLALALELERPFGGWIPPFKDADEIDFYNY